MQLPQLPEMVFAENLLRLQHKDGYGIEFNALDALKRVDSENDPLQVAVSDAWKNARYVSYYLRTIFNIQLTIMKWSLDNNYNS